MCLFCATYSQTCELWECLTVRPSQTPHCSLNRKYDWDITDLNQDAPFRDSLLQYVGNREVDRVKSLNFLQLQANLILLYKRKLRIGIYKSPNTPLSLSKHSQETRITRVGISPLWWTELKNEYWSYTPIGSKENNAVIMHNTSKTKFIAFPTSWGRLSERRDETPSN